MVHHKTLLEGDGLQTQLGYAQTEPVRISFVYYTCLQLGLLLNTPLVHSLYPHQLDLESPSGSGMLLEATDGMGMGIGIGMGS